MVKTTQTRCLIFSLYFMRPTPHTKSTIWKAQTIADWPWHRWSDWRSVARYGAAPSLRQQWLHGWEAGCPREVEWSSSANHRKYGWWCSGQCRSDNGVKYRRGHEFTYQKAPSHSAQPAHVAQPAASQPVVINAPLLICALHPVSQAGCHPIYKLAD